jgi:hypothetical protein
VCPPVLPVLEAIEVEISEGSKTQTRDAVVSTGGTPASQRSSPRRWFRPDPFDVLGLGLLLVFVPLLSNPILTDMIGLHSNRMRYSDYPSHSAYAAQMRREHRLLLPHPLYHLCLLGVQKGVEWRTGESAAGLELPPIGYIRDAAADVLQPISRAYSRAAAIVLRFFLLLTAAILWTQLRRAAGVGSHRLPGNLLATAVAVALVVALMIIAPASLRHKADAQYYVGYIGISVWHSPTVLVAKPLSYLVFLCAIAVFADRSRSQPAARDATISHDAAEVRPATAPVGVSAIVTSALVFLLCALAKPNYILCVLPALAVGVAVDHAQRRPIRWKLLIAGILVPAVAILAWQYCFAFASGSANGIELAPFKVMSKLSRHIGQKFILSILFPLACYLIWLPAIARDLRVNFAWAAFLVGLVFTYFIAEKKNFSDGNFLWGGQLALFVLCAESAMFVMAAARGRWRAGSGRWLALGQAAACAAVFALHLYWGIRYREYLLHAPRGIYQ